MKIHCCVVLVFCFVSLIYGDNDLIKRSSYRVRDQNSRLVKAIDPYAVIALIKPVPTELKRIVPMHKAEMKKCNMRLKVESDHCEKCFNSQTPFKKIGCHIVSKIENFFKKDVAKLCVDAFNAVKGVVKDLKSFIKDFGKDVVKFLDDLGDFTIGIGRDLLEGAGKAVKTVVNAMKKVGRELVRISKKVAKAIQNGVRDIGNEVKDSIEYLGRKTGQVLNEVADFSEDIADDVGDLALGIGKGIGDIAEDVGNTVVDVGQHIGNAAEDFGKGIGHVATEFSKPFVGFANGIAGWFGKKKRRDLDRIARGACSVCGECSKLDPNKFNKTEIIKNVCGPDSFQLEAQLRNILGLFEIMKSKQTVIRQIKYDRDSEDEEDIYKDNFITYRINTTDHTFTLKNGLDTYARRRSGTAIGKHIFKTLKEKQFNID